VLSPKPEQIWQGRIHLGDEPGIFGDAFYSGLAAELPITLERTDPSGSQTPGLIVETQNVQTFSGYPGHLITVRLYEEDPSDPFHYNETVLATERLTTADNNRQEVTVNLANKTSPLFISVGLRIDTDVPPGLYDDFVWSRLLSRSQNFAFVASFGFRA
jgi:hypothetical protein